MGILSDVIKDPAARKRVVDDGVKVIEAEVGDKGGISGMAVKAAFAAVQKVKPGFVGMALNNLLPDFALQVDPFVDQWKAGGKGDLRSYFVANGPAIANALLKITDQRAAKADNPVVKRAYDGLRPTGVNHTVAAMPRLGDLIAKHLPR